MLLPRPELPGQLVPPVSPALLVVVPRVLQVQLEWVAVLQVKRDRLVQLELMQQARPVVLGRKALLVSMVQLGRPG